MNKILNPEPVSEMICYLVLGTALILCNLPVLTVIVAKSSLCVRYCLFTVLFVNCIFLGVNCFIIASYSGSVIGANDTISETGRSCLKKFGVWVDIFCFPMVGVCLLFIGVDRVLVVLFPIKYFRNQRFSVVTQAVAAHIFIIALFGVTVFFSGMRNVGHVSLRCRQHEFIPYDIYLIMIIIRISSASLFIISVCASLILLRSFTEKVIKNENERKLAAFLHRQRILTRGMIFICAYTFVFYVLPSVGALVIHLKNSDELDYLLIFFTFLTYLNELPFAFITFITQPDIRCATLKQYKLLGKLPCFRRFAKEASISFVTRS